MSAVLGLTRLDINFLLVSDSAIRKYNRRFLEHDYVTDVISFPMEEEGVLGDVVISSDTAKRQAKEIGHSLLTELKILAIHGTLHLLGYRDKREKDRKKMWRKTNELLTKIKEI